MGRLVGVRRPHAINRRAPNLSFLIDHGANHSALVRFSQRNVASCFHESDLSASAALSYAVHVLKIEAIIVCGRSLPHPSINATARARGLRTQPSLPKRAPLGLAKTSERSER